eukprot:6278490-Alexandrium_andersonii.AAC.1
MRRTLKGHGTLLAAVRARAPKGHSTPLRRAAAIAQSLRPRYGAGPQQYVRRAFRPPRTC